jgi:hypothetical protein
MKKKIKSQSKLLGEVTFIMSDKPCPPPSKLALRKLAEVNEALSRSKYKTIEEMIKHANDSSHE